MSENTTTDADLPTVAEVRGILKDYPARAERMEEALNRIMRKALSAHGKNLPRIELALLVSEIADISLEGLNDD